MSLCRSNDGVGLVETVPVCCFWPCCPVEKSEGIE